MRKSKWRYPFEINSGVIYRSDWKNTNAISSSLMIKAISAAFAFDGF